MNNIALLIFIPEYTICVTALQKEQFSCLAAIVLR